ncbi:MAG: saccharopine dehydrogenase C-terminal domain-containing protein [Pseudomonadota bacterium]
MANLQSIAVLGLGKIGRLSAELLMGCGFDVLGVDTRPPRDAPFSCQMVDLRDHTALVVALKGQDAVLSCLPYALNTQVAKAAHRGGLHYFDLTEDVATTRAIRTMAETATAAMAPQCGLAPGFVGIVGADLILKLECCRSCRMRVGALPQNPSGLMGYSFNWSPEGVVNEYLNDCEVLENGEIKMVSPMEWVERIVIDGTALEAFTTSGGLGTMCETYRGRVSDIDYKTMRYPGHVTLMNFFFHELLMRDRRKEAGEILVHAKPPVEDDIVYIHVAAEGLLDGKLVRREFVCGLKPMEVAGRVRTAIAWTTASSVAAVIEMVAQGALPQRGFLKQEDIPLPAFLSTKNGKRFAEAMR